MTTSTPATPGCGLRVGGPSQKSKRDVGCVWSGLPVSTAIRASSIWQRMCVRILALRPSLHIAMQSSRDCSEAAGEVSSMYSTPNASSALAIAILVLVSKKALANCSPSIRQNEGGSIKGGESGVGRDRRTSEGGLDDLEVGYV